VRQAADDFVSLMTPIIKAMFTDMGFESAVTGMQVLGGHGYIREWGMEQYVRDARIAQIYEGTNGIQALDLVGRKMPSHAGRLLRRFFHPVLAYIEEKGEDERMAEFVLPLSKAFGRLQQATAEVARRGMGDPFEAGAAATDYLRLFALTALALRWARMAEVALDRQAGEDAGFYRAEARHRALLHAARSAGTARSPPRSWPGVRRCASSRTPPSDAATGRRGSSPARGARHLSARPDRRSGIASVEEDGTAAVRGRETMFRRRTLAAADPGPGRPRAPGGAQARPGPARARSASSSPTAVAPARPTSWRASWRSASPSRPAASSSWRTAPAAAAWSAGTPRCAPPTTARRCC
jgi:hypothetical protein